MAFKKHVFSWILDVFHRVCEYFTFLLSMLCGCSPARSHLLWVLHTQSRRITIAIAGALRSSTSLTALNTLHRFRNYFMVISSPENPTKAIKYCAPDWRLLAGPRGCRAQAVPTGWGFALVWADPTKGRRSLQIFAPSLSLRWGIKAKCYRCKVLHMI